MSLSASRDVARSIGEAFYFLRRSGHEAGREFLLQTGTDLHCDASLLSSPEVLCNANAASVVFELPVAGDEPLARYASAMHVAFVQIPLVTGNLTRGLCVQVQTSDRPLFGVGSSAYSAGRYVRCEATGECLMFMRPSGDGAVRNGSAAMLVYSRRDSPGGRFHMFAVTRLGVTMRQIYEDYDRGQQTALYRNFTLLHQGTYVPVGGCPECGLSEAEDCSCDVVATVPKSSSDFRYAKSLVGTLFSFGCVTLSSTNADCITTSATLSLTIARIATVAR